jgi:DNA ligase-associated metallophosphoesterase
MAEPARRIAAEATIAPTFVTVAGVAFEALPEGALWWRKERLLVVADLHLEKGSAFAERGQMLPPYDTAETLFRLTQLVARLDPTAVVSLGDSFHDNGGPERLSDRDRAALARLGAGREWIWIAGNHDPALGRGLGGLHFDSLAISRILFRHEPAGGGSPGEIAAHLHPAARVSGAGRSVRRRCFVGDGTRLVLPAFGAYAGGLNVLGPAFDGLFSPKTFRAFMLGENRVYPVGRRALWPD